MRRVKLRESSEGLTDAVQQARLDCHMYFLIREFGWGTFRREGTTMRQVAPSPVSGLRRLGYPGRGRLWRAVSRVKKTCPEQTRRYERALKLYREAQRRIKATRSETAYEWYRMGAGNRNSVAYNDYFVRRARNGRGGAPALFRCLFFRYRFADLRSRKSERKRAFRDRRAAARELVECRLAIFVKMGVPKKFQNLA